MNNSLKCFLAFSLGAVAGSLATYKIVKTKCEQRADEEIASVKEMLCITKPETEECEEEEEENIASAASINAKVNMQKSSLQDYAAVLKKSGYTNYSDSEQNDNNEEDTTMSKDTSHIELIYPDEFDTEDGYEAVTLTYYEGDGVLTDEWDNPIEDVDFLVGDDFAEHYGEFEEDTVYVRNHKTKGDYEICRDLRSFREVVGDSYPMEG